MKIQDSFSQVDPELRAFLSWPMRLLTTLTAYRAMIPLMRKMARLAFGDRTPFATPAYEERLIPGPDGAPPVRCYVVNAGPRNLPRPALLFLHGGGYIGGAAWASVRDAQRIATDHDCVVVVADYRLAPETPFPGSLEDNYQALRWMHQSARELGIDPARIAVMGESAGGGHAAALAIAARDRGEFPIAFQVLIYPMLDDRTGSSRPAAAHTGEFVWTRRLNRLGWSCLLGAPAGSAQVPPGAVPARVDQLAGLPPAFIGVGELDLFWEEDCAYARRLQAAGVPVELLEIPQAYHGFNVVMPQAACSVQFTAAWNDALRRALH
jgi:acetyl esterase/lipase